MKLKVGDRVRCIADNGGGVRIGDEGEIIEAYSSEWYPYRVWFDTMNKYCKRRGYWTGRDRHLELVEPRGDDDDELYY